TWIRSAPRKVDVVVSVPFLEAYAHVTVFVLRHSGHTIVPPASPFMIVIPPRTDLLAAGRQVGQADGLFELDVGDVQDHGHIAVRHDHVPDHAVGPGETRLRLRLGPDLALAIGTQGQELRPVDDLAFQLTLRSVRHVVFSWETRSKSRRFTTALFPWTTLVGQ